VGAQDDALVGGVKGVPHVASRVVGRHVEQLKVVLVAFYVGAAINLEPHLGKDGVNLAQGLGAGMQAAGLQRPARQSHVDGPPVQAALQLGCLDLPGTRLVGCFQRLLDLVGPPPKGRSFLSG
jgi:hypothetical protein